LAISLAYPSGEEGGNGNGVVHQDILILVLLVSAGYPLDFKAWLWIRIRSGLRRTKVTPKKIEKS
jgi:hypothetical protein